MPQKSGTVGMKADPERLRVNMMDEEKKKIRWGKEDAHPFGDARRWGP